MVEIIPSINVRTFEEVRERIAKVERYVSWCHLDVTDGVFSKHPTWHDPADLQWLDTKLKAEVHLMVAEPEKTVSAWLIKPIKRVIVHLEAMRDPERIIIACRDAGVAIGFAINPETFWGKLETWFGKVDLLQILAVSPGPSGQKMRDDQLDKIMHLHQSCPHCILEVDGGVNLDTAPKILAAGAQILVAGSVIFSAPDAGKIISNFNSL